MKTLSAIKKSTLYISTFLLLALCLTLASCDGKSSDVIATNGIMTAPRMMSKAANFSTMEVAEESAVFEDNAIPNPDVNIPAERKLIRNGDVNLEVDSLSKTIEAVEKWVASLGGYISNTNQNQTYVNVTVQIPCEKFDDAMNTVGDFGKIHSKNIYTNDVTEQYYDLETRLQTKKVLLNKLQGYLKNASNMDEILKIESKIANVTSELENMQGQMNRLSKQINYSQLTIFAELPSNHTEEGFVFPDAKEGFRNFVSNFVDFIFGFFMAILYIAIFGTPIVLFLIFLYWLCFGKLGLVKKLFKKAK